MKTTFGSGCFWCSEDVFMKVNGVTSTAVGYMGGSLENPTYEQVCTDRTGHAEVVQLEYDPSVVSYEELLQAFWSSHDPTTMNRQGPDVGMQYRSVVFFHDKDQEKAAIGMKEKLQQKLGKKEIVTEITPADKFWKAELAYEIVKEGLNYFKTNDLITSMAHQRVVEEVDDMLRSELRHASIIARARIELRNKTPPS